jgi:hypothetical protein
MNTTPEPYYSAAMLTNVESFRSIGQQLNNSRAFHKKIGTHFVTTATNAFGPLCSNRLLKLKRAEHADATQGPMVLRLVGGHPDHHQAA